MASMVTREDLTEKEQKLEKLCFIFVAITDVINVFLIMLMTIYSIHHLSSSDSANESPAICWSLIGCGTFGIISIVFRIIKSQSKRVDIGIIYIGSTITVGLAEIVLGSLVITLIGEKIVGAAIVILGAIVLPLFFIVVAMQALHVVKREL
nr:hypothetical transcript [Hymenolepis microstoma]